MKFRYYEPTSLSVPFYDIVTDATFQVGDVDFYATLSRAAGHKVLELGCGTGRVTLALAERGLDIVGVDLSEAMLKAAVQKCRAAPPEVAARITLVHGDMTAVRLPNQFDAVIVPFYGFSHLTDTCTRSRALSVIAKHLRPGGSAAIDVPPRSHLLPPMPKLNIAGWVNDGQHQVTIRAIDRTFDDETGRFCQIMEYHVRDRFGNTLRRTEESVIYYWFSDDELNDAASNVGLRLDAVLSSFVGGEKESAHVYILSKVTS